MTKCSSGCTPCCDFCKHVIRETWEDKETGIWYEDGPIGCKLHSDKHHQELAEACSYCNDYHCSLAKDFPIYVIYMMEKINEEMKSVTGKPIGWPDMGCTEIAGFYYNEEDAILTLNKNCGDVQEHCYKAAFILQWQPGLYPTAAKEQRKYFVWNEEKQGFFQQEEPEIFKHCSI